MKHIHILLLLLCLVVSPSGIIFADSLTESTWHFDDKRKSKGDFVVNFDNNGTFTGIGTSSKFGMLVIKGTYEWLKKNKFEGDFHIKAYDHKYIDKGSLKCKLKDRESVIKCKIYNGILPFGFNLLLVKNQHETKEYVKVKSKVLE